MYHINISTIHASSNVLRKNRPPFPHSSQLWATQADRLGLEMLHPASDSLELPRGILESARRSLGEVGNTVGKTLGHVLSLLSCSGKTHEEGCWISKINNPLCSQAFQADSEGYVYFNFLYSPMLLVCGSIWEHQFEVQMNTTHLPSLFSILGHGLFTPFSLPFCIYFNTSE